MVRLLVIALMALLSTGCLSVYSETKFVPVQSNQGWEMNGDVGSGIHYLLFCGDYDITINQIMKSSQLKPGVFINAPKGRILPFPWSLDYGHWPLNVRLVISPVYPGKKVKPIVEGDVSIEVLVNGGSAGEPRMSEYIAKSFKPAEPTWKFYDQSHYYDIKVAEITQLSISVTSDKLPCKIPLLDMELKELETDDPSKLP